VLRLARLAQALPDDLESIEVNPLWVRGHQVEGLDALVTWQTTTESRNDHVLRH
jgi:acetate---CoA ligase (ADP-forming)